MSERTGLRVFNERDRKKSDRGKSPLLDHLDHTRARYGRSRLAFRHRLWFGYGDGNAPRGVRRSVDRRGAHLWSRSRCLEWDPRFLCVSKPHCRVHRFESYRYRGYHRNVRCGVGQNHRRYVRCRSVAHIQLSLGRRRHHPARMRWVRSEHVFDQYDSGLGHLSTWRREWIKVSQTESNASR